MNTEAQPTTQGSDKVVTIESEADLPRYLNDPYIPYRARSNGVGGMPELPSSGGNSIATFLYHDFKRIADSLERIVEKWQVTTPSPEPLSANGDGWMNVEETARYMKLSSRAIRDGATSGNLPAHKYPAGSTRGQWRFSRSELDRHLSKRQKARQKPEMTIWS